MPDELADREPGPLLGLAGHGQCGEHYGQVGLDRVPGADEHRPCTKVGLGHPERLLDAPQVVVGSDDLAIVHEVRTDGCWRSLSAKLSVRRPC